MNIRFHDTYWLKGSRFTSVVTLYFNLIYEKFYWCKWRGCQDWGSFSSEASGKPYVLLQLTQTTPQFAAFPSVLLIKGIARPKMKILSFAQPRIVPNLLDIHSSVRYFESVFLSVIWKSMGLNVVLNHKGFIVWTKTVLNIIQNVFCFIRGRVTIICCYFFNLILL